MPNDLSSLLTALYLNVNIRQNNLLEQYLKPELGNMNLKIKAQD